jgi:BirA family transcriptional regulator, biotin operon repressor / biotin---[acetyl-CoA-carboxylase] ligase
VKNAKWIANVCLQLDKTTSTNDDARRWVAESPPPEGAVIRANEQTAGRGQMGTRWHSQPGQNLTFSLILYPKWLPPDQQFKLSMAVALAVRAALAELIPVPVVVKWPNDLLIGGKKIAGILIQNTLSGSEIQCSIVGIGLNVNQELFEEFEQSATSLCLQTKSHWNLDEVAELVYAQLEYFYEWIKRTPFNEIAALYCQHLYGYGQNIRFQHPSDSLIFEGQITGISQSGRLQIQGTEGTSREYDLKEIHFIRE